MQDLVHRALNAAEVHGANYADVRFVERRVETVTVKNGNVEGTNISTDRGFGVRVLVNGAWGFACSSRLDHEAAEETARLAVRIARASALAKRLDVTLAPLTPVVARYATPVVKDPFAVSLEDRTALLLEADAAMRSVPGVALTESSVEIWRERKYFASSEGARIEQEIIQTGAGIMAVAVKEGEMQQRSYPNSFGRHCVSSGWEAVEAMELVKHAPRIAEEAVALLSAPQCPSGRTTLIIDSPQVALQIHESCGHPIELDRVFGMEASYAGTSFLTTDKLGHFRYGSPQVNITADATYPGGLGTFGFDDEGVPAQRTPIVREGIFVGYLTSRDTAARLDQTSMGAMRADGWNRIPLIRMTNINIEPGTWTLEDLIADTDDGLFITVNKSWSIDDKRLNFQFATEIGWEIKNGKLGRMIKNPTYTGITPEFWGSCDAVCNADHWVMWGTPNCGKGQPGQTGRVGHGAAPARFRNVQVGVGKW